MRHRPLRPVVSYMSWLIGTDLQTYRRAELIMIMIIWFLPDLWYTDTLRPVFLIWVGWTLHTYRRTDKRVNYDYDHLIFARFMIHRPLRPVSFLYELVDRYRPTDLHTDRVNYVYDHLFLPDSWYPDL